MHVGASISASGFDLSYILLIGRMLNVHNTTVILIGDTSISFESLD